MDPVLEALSSYSLDMIKLAGAATITFVIAYVGIQKVAGLVGDEGKEEKVFNGYGYDEAARESRENSEDERYEYFIMDNVAEYKHFSEEDWDRLSHLKEKYGNFTEKELDHYHERYAKETAYFDEDD